MSLEARELAADITAELCLELTARAGALGVFAEHLPPLDVKTFVAAVADGAKDRGAVRCALLGAGDVKLRAPKGVEITFDPTVANRWRNDKAAREGTPCFTLALGPAPKLNSLRTALILLSQDAVRDGVVRRSTSLLDSPERRAYWRALGERRAEIPLAALIEYAAELAKARARSEAALLDVEPKLVHLVGLLQQPALHSRGGIGAARATLRRNLDLVRRLRALPQKERQALATVLEDGVPADRTLAKLVLKFERSGAPADLANLHMERVQVLLKAPPKKKPDDDEEEGRDARPKRPRERLDGDALALELLLDEGGRGMGVAAKRYRTELEPVDDDGEIAPDEITVGRRHVLPRPKVGTAQATSLFGRLLSKDCWGGFVEANEASDLVAALKMVSSGDLHPTFFTPNAKDDDGVRSVLERAANRGYIAADALKRWDEYSAARTALLPHAGPLTDHPLLALGGSPALRTAAQDVIDTYGRALNAVGDAAAALRKVGSVEAAKRLLGRTLCLDVAFVRTASEFSAIAGPTHPFHLWRWLTLLGIIETHREDLVTIGGDVIEPLVTDPPASAPSIVLSAFALKGALDRAHPFVAVGSFGALPLFGEPTARQLGKFRARALAAIAERLLRLMPHASFGLRVLLVDPPSLVGAIEDLLELDAVFEEGGRVPLHVTVARTRRPNDATDEEDQDIDQVARDLRDRGGSLTVAPVDRPLADIAVQLQREPVHLAVIFDPGEGQELRVGIARPPALSPFVLPRAYRYDDFDDRLDVVVAGEAGPFKRYHDLFCESLDLPRDDFIGRRSGASRMSRELEAMARSAVWLVVVDQGLEPTLRLTGASRLDWRTDGGRDVVTFTAHPETVEDLVADAIRQAGLRPSEETTKRTLQQLFALSGEALLQLARPRPDVSLADARVAKGTLGVLASVRWYERAYPDSVVVSLDEPLSRRWLLGRELSDRQGDLLGVRLGPDGVVVEAVEVKAREDEAGVFTADRGAWEGSALQQIDNTLRTLKAVLRPATEAVPPVDRARQDIIRDQLYRAVAMRPYSPDQRRRLVGMLQELFERGPIELRGLMFLVKIQSGLASTGPSAPAMGRSPADNQVGVVELTEGEADERPKLNGAKQTQPTLPPGGPSASKKGRSGGRKRRTGNEEDSGSKELEETPATGPSVAASDRLRVLIGKNPLNQPVEWDPHHPTNPLNNFGMLITGDPGAGKTQILRALIAEVRGHQLPVLVFDFKNDYAADDFAPPIGLKVYDVDRDGLPFNPLTLVADRRGEAQPIRQINELSGILRRIFGLGEQQEARLKKAMRAAYEVHGLAAEARIQVTAATPSPVFAEVRALLAADEKSEALLNRLSPLFDLNLFPASGKVKTTFDRLLAEGSVLLLNSLPDDRIKAAMAEFIIVRLHSHLLKGEQPRQLRRLLVFDEAWRVKDSERLQELAREGRAFGVGIAIGTQFPGDLPENLAGNLATQLLLQNNDQNHRKAVVRALCGTSSGPQAQQLMSQIDRLKKHEGFLRNQQYAPCVLVETLPHYKRQPHEA